MSLADIEDRDLMNTDSSWVVRTGEAKDDWEGISLYE
jgi:hypothetical protein